MGPTGGLACFSSLGVEASTQYQRLDSEGTTPLQIPTRSRSFFVGSRGPSSTDGIVLDSTSYCLSGASTPGWLLQLDASDPGESNSTQTVRGTSGGHVRGA